MWYHGMKVKAVQPRVLVNDIHTMGGQSGSPLWIKRNGKRIQVGIHTNGMASGIGNPHHRARAGKHEEVESNIGPGSRLPGGGDIAVRRRALPSQQEEF